MLLNARYIFVDNPKVNASEHNIRIYWIQLFNKNMLEKIQPNTLNDNNIIDNLLKKKNSSYMENVTDLKKSI